jgi:hypothetical protein
MSIEVVNLRLGRYQMKWKYWLRYESESMILF